MRSLASRADGSPSTSTFPASGNRMDMMRRMEVVLPAPLGPISPQVSPFGMARSSALTARWAPKDFSTPCNFSAACTSYSPLRRNTQSRGRADYYSSGDRPGAVGRSTLAGHIQVGKGSFQGLRGHAHGLRQRGMRMDGQAHVSRVCAQLDGQRHFGNQLAGIGADDAGADHAVG